MLAKKQAGFTLIEIAIVLVIVGLLVGSFIGTFSNRIDATRRADTNKNLIDIKQVLMAFAYSQGTDTFLPCPDTDTPPDGIENRSAGVCDPGSSLGTLPWVTLGIGRQDAWATHYRYWVNDDYASDAGFGLDGDDTGGGNAEIRTRVNDAVAVIAENAVAVIFSHGKNSLGGVSADGINRDVIPAGSVDENENGNGDSIYIARPPSEAGSAAAGKAFDDMLIWINSFELKAKMVEAGKLP